jgi:formate hydrogenlyase subunit 3/multisubunit Na+/H+ antiporter MnhD subunit
LRIHDAPARDAKCGRGDGRVSGPLLLFLGSGGLALAGVVLRGRTRLVAGVTALGCALLGVFAAAAPLDVALSLLGLSYKVSSEWVVMGRAFVLDEGNRLAVGILYFAVGGVFAGGIVARPARHFYGVGVLCLATVGGSLMIRPFLYAAVLMELTAMGAAWLLAGTNRNAQTAATRLLVLTTLGMMAVLLAGWLVDSVGVAAGDPMQARRASLLLALGFAILMGVPPFHHWLPPAAEGSHPYALALVVILLQSAGLFFLLRFLDSYEWLRDNQALFDGIRLAGMVAMGLGAAWGVAQQSRSRLVAYLVLADVGAVLMAVSLQSGRGYTLAVGMIVARAIGLAAWGAGASAGVHAPAGAAGARGRLTRMAHLASGLGLLSLAGVPLTAGFPLRWDLIEILAAGDLAGSVVVAASMLGLAVSMPRWFLVEGAATREDAGAASWLERGAFGMAAALCIAAGIAPGLLGGVGAVIDGLRNLAG